MTKKALSITAVSNKGRTTRLRDIKAESSIKNEIN